jgi:hypothetical protein
VSNQPPKHAKPLLEAFPNFFEPDVQRQCQRGEFICWGRRGNRDAPRSQVPTSAWPFIKILSPDFLYQQELREERVKMRHPQTGRDVFVTEERLCAIEKWFDPLFVLACNIPPVREQRDRSALRREVARWIKAKFGALPPEQVPNRDQMFEAARSRWSDDVKPTWIKEQKPRSRSGRRKKSGGK